MLSKLLLVPNNYLEPRNTKLHNKALVQLVPPLLLVVLLLQCLLLLLLLLLLIPLLHERIKSNHREPDKLQEKN